MAAGSTTYGVWLVDLLSVMINDDHDDEDVFCFDIFVHA